MYFPHAYNKDSFTKNCVHSHAHTQRVHGPSRGLKASRPSSNPKRLADLQHQVPMAVVRNYSI